MPITPLLVAAVLSASLMVAGHYIFLQQEELHRVWAYIWGVGWTLLFATLATSYVAPRHYTLTVETAAYWTAGIYIAAFAGAGIATLGCYAADHLRKQEQELRKARNEQRFAKYLRELEGSDD